MLWPAAMITFSYVRAAVDDRQAVVSHRPPAEPLFQHRLAVGLVEIVGRSVLQELEPLGADRLVVAGEFHGRAQPVARLKRRHRDAGLGKDQRDLGADGRPRHGQAVAFARLDRDPAAQVLVQERRPGTGGDDEQVGRQLASRRVVRPPRRPFRDRKPSKRTVLADRPRRRLRGLAARPASACRGAGGRRRDSTSRRPARAAAPARARAAHRRRNRRAGQSNDSVINRSVAA